MITTKHQNELKYLEIVNNKAEAKIALQGAQLFHFQVKGKKPLLWLSDTSLFEKGKAIRGGIPICWPWFGEHKKDIELASHGFARTSVWEVVDTNELSENESRIKLMLKSSTESLSLWPYFFELILEVSIGEVLKLSLTTKNIDDNPFKMSSALHSYFAIEDITKVSIEGLEQKSYYNKVDDSLNNKQDGKLFITQETDRIYQNIIAPIVINDSNQAIMIQSQGSNTIVVWNPWSELAENMSDLSDYKTMLCIENANTLLDECLIEPNCSHKLKVIISQQ